MDIDLTLQGVVAATSAGDDTNQVVRQMLQSVADIPLGDWFECAIGPPVLDLNAAPYGGARYPVEARMGERTFADSTWTPALVTLLCIRWKRSSAGIGWDSPASKRRGFG